MSLGLRFRLSLMMFLQYAVWSIWALMLVVHLGPKGLGIREWNIGLIMACGGIGSLIGPWIMGQLADRYFATEYVLAFSHLVGGALLIAAGHQTEFWPIFVLMLIYSALYFPSVALTNSLTFRALGEGNANQFAPIRLWGSIGWLTATFLTGRYLNSGGVEALQPLFNLVGDPSLRDVLRIPGLISIVYGFYCLTLPHTPPVPAQPDATGQKRSALVESLALMKDPGFAVLLVVAAILGMTQQYYFQSEGGFLPAIGSNPNNVGTQMTIGQVGEIITMALVPLAVVSLGYKWSMVVGASAYALLFGLNAIGQPWELMVGANFLHGISFGLFFVVAMQYVDRVSTTDIKASAQNLFVFMVFGVANIVGNLAAGAIREALLPDWRAVWAVPFVVTVLAILIFIAFFREQPAAASIEKPAEAEV